MTETALVDDFGTGNSSVSRLAHTHSLKLRAIAEGVEDAETLAKLRDLGCDAAQGYYYTRPVDAVATTEMIATSPQWEAVPAAV